MNEANMTEETKETKKHTYKQRLLTLAALMRRPEVQDRFEYDTWAGGDGKPWLGAPDLSCGTVACVAGWATTLPFAAPNGIRLAGADSHTGQAKIVCGYTTDHSGDLLGAVLFGLTYSESAKLFMPWVYNELIERNNNYWFMHDLSAKSSPTEIAEAIENLAEFKYPGIRVTELIPFSIAPVKESPLNIPNKAEYEPG